MRKFWENTPEWRRQKEAYGAMELADEQCESAGRALLAAIACYGPTRTSREDLARERYMAAYSEAVAAREDWDVAHKAFHLSPAGKARARFIEDPLASCETAAVPDQAEVLAATRES